MALAVEFAADAIRDFGLIFDHLQSSYRAVGEDAVTAVERAAQRVRELRAKAEALGEAPHRGTRHDDIAPGLRHIPIDRAIFWFQLDEAAGRLRVLAIFFGGEDHVRRMLLRLLGP